MSSSIDRYAPLEDALREILRHYPSIELRGSSAIEIGRVLLRTSTLRSEDPTEAALVRDQAARLISALEQLCREQHP